MSEQESATMEREREIRGAVARGWCADKNRFKEMDVDLAEAISQEVVAYCASRELAAEEAGAHETWEKFRKYFTTEIGDQPKLGEHFFDPQGSLARVVQQAVEAERERCARVAERVIGEKFIEADGHPRAEIITKYVRRTILGDALPATVSPGTVEADGQALEQDKHRNDYVAGHG